MITGFSKPGIMYRLIMLQAAECTGGKRNVPGVETGAQEFF